MDGIFSPAGLIGAAIGATVGWVNFRIVTGFVTTRLRALDRSASAGERADFEGKLVLMQRLVFVLTVPAIAGVGYWFGRTLGG